MISLKTNDKYDIGMHTKCKTNHLLIECDFQIFLWQCNIVGGNLWGTYARQQIIDESQAVLILNILI